MRGGMYALDRPLQDAAPSGFKQREPILVGFSYTSGQALGLGVDPAL